MKTSLKRFVAKTIVLTVAIAIISWLLHTLVIPQYYLPIFPYMLIFFLVVTISIHAYQLNLARKNMAKFTRSIMLVTFLKLVIYSVFAIIYIAQKPENAVVFVIVLFVLYFTYTFLEVSEIAKVARGKVKITEAK